MAGGRLYELLGVEPTATPAEVVRAYRIRALQVHPDKNPDDEDASGRFQLLQAAYEVLKDPKRRARYDESGLVDEDSEGFDEAYERFRGSFAEVTEEAIRNFAATYLGSDDEAEDIANFYRKFGGDLSKFFECVPLSDPADCERYLDLIRRLIEEGVIELTRKFTSSSKKFEVIGAAWQKKHAKEAKAAKRHQAVRDGRGSSKKRCSEEAAPSGGMGDLVAAIRGNQARRAGRPLPGEVCGGAGATPARRLVLAGGGRAH